MAEKNTLDIRNVEFTRSGMGGYKQEDVHSFLDKVATSYEALVKENADLNRKLHILAQSVEKYRSDEDSIRDAFMNAQRAGDQHVRESHKKAEAILKDATMKANSMIAEAQRQVKNEQQALEKAKKDVAAFKNRVMIMYREHITMINALPSDDIERKPEPTKVPVRPQVSAPPKVHANQAK